MIDWSRLARAVAFYTSRGYRYVEVPWLAPDDAVAITAPNRLWRMPAQCMGGTLIGSAEQGFLALSLDQTMGIGKFVSCSPCFRLAEDLDELHRTEFMKVELFRNDSTEEADLFDLMADARAFFHTEIPSWLRSNLRTVTTLEGYDFDLGDIEIGSYGIRHDPANHLQWVYGTGVAEPRFSSAMQLNRSTGDND